MRHSETQLEGENKFMRTTNRARQIHILSLVVAGLLLLADVIWIVYLTLNLTHACS